jgi:hypothetical protein
VVDFKLTGGSQPVTDDQAAAAERRAENAELEDQREGKDLLSNHAPSLKAPCLCPCHFAMPDQPADSWAPHSRACCSTEGSK